MLIVIVMLQLLEDIRYFLTLFRTGVAIIAKFYAMKVIAGPMSSFARCGEERMLEVLQSKYSSLFKLEDQNCLLWPGYVLTLWKTT